MTENLKRSRGRPKTYDREEILEKAMLLFWEHGYEGVSVSDLTEALGMQPQSLYVAFKSKEQLFREVVGHYYQTRLAYMRQAFEEEKTAGAAINRILDECAARYASGESPAGCLIGTGILRSAQENTAITALLSAMRDASRDRMIERFKEAVDAGEINPSVDLEALARFYASVVQGMSVQAIDGASSDKLKKVASMAMNMWPVLTASD